MKKYLLLLAIITIGYYCPGQITLEYKTGFVCEFNEKTGDYDLNCTSLKEEGKFEFNRLETEFVHTTPEISSKYFVDHTDHQFDKGFFVYFVESDAHNKYVHMIDMHKRVINILVPNGLVTFMISNIYTTKTYKHE